ncbi:MAG: CTB family bacteriocin (plasmid) [Leptolyngbya sp. BL-A-14]
MTTDLELATLSPCFETGRSKTGLIALSDDELDTVAGGSHHHGHHHHRHHHGHHRRGGAIAHSSQDFFERSLSISVQKTTDAHGNTTNFSIELTEIMSHSEQT